MAGEIQLNSTTMATESSGTITLSNVDSATNRTNLGLGSMATQNANAVAITGGNISSSVTIDAGSNVSGIGQLVGISYANAYNSAGNTVTTEANKSYAAIVTSYRNPYASSVESWTITTDSSNNATVTELGGVYNQVAIEATTGGVRLEASGDNDFGFGSAFIFEQTASFDGS